jgi:aminoglycoside phosphotransferase (APT) family kinase protein
MDSALKAGIVRALERRGMALSGGEAGLTRLAGGGWNDVFRLQSPGIDWVAKLYNSGQQQSLFPMLPEAEVEALEALRGRKVAPEPVAFLKSENDLQGLGRPMLVYVFYPGQQWVSGVEAVAEMFRRQHGLAPEALRPLAVEPGAILYQGDQLLAKLADDAWAQQLKAARPTPPLGLPRGRRALVHTDAGPGNIIQGADGPRLIGWRCPGIGDPAEDLYSFLSPASQILSKSPLLSSNDHGSLLRHYGDAVTAERLDLMWPSYSYRMLAYCRLRARELQHRDPKLSERYRHAFEAEFATL